MALHTLGAIHNGRVKLARTRNGGVPEGSESDAKPLLVPAERPRLADHAYEEIRRTILQGLVPMGQRLLEVELSRQLGMSRAPLREAIRRLVEEGLLEERPQKGVYVRQITPDDIIDMYNARMAFESLAARLVIRSGVSTAPLRELVEKLEGLAVSGDERAVTAEGLNFHRALCELSGNLVILEMFDSLAARLQLAIALHDAEVGDSFGIAHSHVEVLEAVESGDEVAAVEAVGSHVLTTVGSLVRSMGGDPALLLPPGVYRPSGPAVEA